MRTSNVLVGATAVGTHDLLSTPLSPLYPAVEVHATVIDNILTQDFLTRPNWSKTYDLLAIITLGVLSGITLPWLGPLKGLLGAAGLGVLYLVMACWWFVHAGVWLILVYPMQAIGTLPGGIAHDFNNILTVILGYAELAMEERQQDTVLRGYLQGVLTAGHRAKGLVQQILAFSRQTEHERAPMQVHLLVKEVLDLLRAALPSTITLQPVIDPYTGFVLALYTGFSDTMVAERARVLGIDAFILKPVRVRNLNLAIRQVLAQRMAQET
jgi:signal transduction histidine kinase